jgi:hypothetical protein
LHRLSFLPVSVQFGQPPIDHYLFGVIAELSFNGRIMQLEAPSERARRWLFFIQLASPSIKAAVD